MLLSDLKPPSVTSPYVSRPPDVDIVGAALRMSRMYYDRYTWILDWSNVQGKTALHIAALKGNEELVRVSVEFCISCLLSTDTCPDAVRLGRRHQPVRQ